MTSTAESKALAEAYFQAISDNRPGDAWAMLADDAIWTIGGHSPLTGTYNKEQLAELTERKIFARLTDGLTVKLKRLLAEDDLVVAEFESTGERPDGVVYNNHFCFIMTVKDGKFRRCTEYLDTYHFNEVILN